MESYSQIHSDIRSLATMPSIEINNSCSSIRDTVAHRIQESMGDRAVSRLSEIHPFKWPELRDKYLVDWPKNMLGYYTMDNYLRWVTIDPDIANLCVYALDNDWSDGTFVVIVSIFVH